MSKKTFKIGGVHPPGHKDASLDLCRLPLPKSVIVPLSQHIGASATPVVKKGDKVERLQLIGKGEAFVSANVHSPISGIVKAVEPLPMAGGVPLLSVVIEASQEELDKDAKERGEFWSAIDRGEGLNDRDDSADALRAKIREAGIVGLGGAAFPSHVKYTVKPEIRVETLIINACECEPYLRCDDALMNAYPRQIVAGVRMLKKATGADRCVIAIEDNKPQSISKLKKAVEGIDDIEICELVTKYPQGGEKQVIEAVTGRRLASGALPLSVGAVVANVATAFAVWQAVVFDMPLVERAITLSGDGMPEDRRGNYIAAIGMPLSELPIPTDDVKIIVGGPMMGKTAVDLRGPVVKGSSGLTILPPKMRKEPQACIRCAACVEACPMGLEPYLLSRLGMLNRWEEARNLDVTDCLECGACSYICPSSRPLLDYIRLAKQKSRLC